MASSLLPNYGQFDTQSTSYGLGQELPPELALKAQALNRRQHIANLLTTQGMQPLQGQMAGRFYVPPSWAQGLSQIGQILAGQYMTHRNDAALEDIGQRNQDMQKQAMLDYFKTRDGVPQKPGPDVQVGEKMDLGGMVNIPGGGSAFLNDSGAQPVTAVNPAVQKVAQAQQANYIKGALGSDFAPEGQPNPEYAAALRQNVAGAAQANYPAPVPQAPQNPNMSPVMGPGPNIPAIPGDSKAAMLQLLTDSRLPRGLATTIANFQQHEDDTNANRAFQADQKQQDREVRREGLEQSTALRLEQMRQNQNLLQMQIDERNARGQDTRELQKQLADQQNDMRREASKAEDLRAKRHDETLKEIARMNTDAKREALQNGKVPQGYRMTADGNLEAIPGGPADLKQQGALNQDTAMLQNSHASLDRLASTANQLLNHPGLAGIVGVRGKIPDIPGTDAANARALINTLKSQVGFGVLQEMRNNSKTGGALGSVSDAEGKRLENNLAALDTTQGLEQFKKQLQDGILGYVDQAKDRLREAYNMKHKSGPPSSFSPPSAPTPSVNTKGWKLMQDASGNKAYVSPDGKQFEEVR